MVKQPGLFSPKFGVTSSSVFTQSTQKVAAEPGIHSLACWGKFFVHNPLDIKESDDHALDIAFHLYGLFWPWWRGFFPGRIVALSQGRNRKPSCHHQWWPWTRMFHHRRRADEVQCRRWRAAASGELSGSWTQIWLRHGACPILRQNPLACPITNSHLLSNVVNGPTPILTDELLNSCNSCRSCAACGSPCVFVIVNWCVTGLEPGMPLKHARTTQALVPEGLLNNCEGLGSTFSKTGTKFDAHSLFFSLIHRENCHRSHTQLQINACENCALPPSYVQLGTLTH